MDDDPAAAGVDGPASGPAVAPDAAELTARARRHDPRRRTRILDACLDVLCTHGLAGTTHRAVAEAADVPLGSITYHFASRDDLVHAAFERFVGQQRAVFDGLFEDVGSIDRFVDVLEQLVVGSPARRCAAVLGFELRLAALRHPRLRQLNAEWSRASRETLAHFVPPAEAGGLDALLEGLIMHAVLSAGPPPAPVVRDAIARAVRAPTPAA